MKLLRPTNHILFDNTLSVLNGTAENKTCTCRSASEQYRIFIHYLLNRSINIAEKTMDTDHVYLYKSFLNKGIFNTDSSIGIIEIAEQTGSIMVNHGYAVGDHPKSYAVQFSGDLSVEAYDYDFKFKVNRKKFVALLCPISYTKDANSRIQVDFIISLTCDYAKLDSFINRSREWHCSLTEGQPGPGITNHLALLESQCHSFDNLSCYSKYDSFAGRYYNFFSNKKSGVRKCFNYNGEELASLDIKSSHMYFLSQLQMIDLSAFPEVDRGKVIICTKFRETVIAGDIYMTFAIRLGIGREEAKKRLLSWLYGDRRFRSIEKAFREEFPVTYGTIEYLRSVEPIKRDLVEVKWLYGIGYERNNFLCYLLQKVEKDIFLGSLVGLENYYTVHDSVYFPASEERAFNDKILTYFIELGLDRPKLELD